MTWRPGFILAPILALGLAGTVVAVKDRESDTAFIAVQQNLSPLDPAVLQRFVASARDPRPGRGGVRGVSATCAAHGTGELRNPWTCLVRYPNDRIRYSVEIQPDGRVQGRDRTGAFTVYGCCVGSRPAQ